MPCFPQYNCTHQNFKEKLCPELDGPRAETAPRPLRTHRLTPLAFAPPRTPIYCENTGIRTLPYFQTATLSHACHVPYFQTCTLSHACHVTELFKCELPVDYVDPHHICISSLLRTAITPCFPQYNCTHQNFKERLCPELDGARARDRAETAPHTPSHTTSFRPPAHSDLLWKHRDSHTSLLSNCHIVPRLPRSLLSTLHIIPRLPRDWAIQVWATCWLCWPTPHLHQQLIANSNHALLPPI